MKKIILFILGLASIIMMFIKCGFIERVKSILVIFALCSTIVGIFWLLAFIIISSLVGVHEAWKELKPSVILKEMCEV